MNKAVISAFSVFVLLVAANGHYIPSRYHWRQSNPYPQVHHYNHMQHYPVHPGFMGHSAGGFMGHSAGGIKGHSAGGFMGHSAGGFMRHSAGGVMGHSAGQNARPAFPAPGSITGESEDQLLELLATGIHLSEGSPLGILSLLRAF